MLIIHVIEARRTGLEALAPSSLSSFLPRPDVGKVQVDAIRARLKGVVVNSGLGRKDESERGRDLEPCPPRLYHMYY